MNDFNKADQEAEELVSVGDIFSAKGEVASPPQDIFEHREQLIRRHYNGESSLLDKLKNEDRSDIEELVMALLDEIIKESDNMLGNGLLAMADGNLRDASVIGYKRTEIMEKAIKAIQAKHAINKDRGIDVNSPHMVAIFRYFMRKTQEVFTKLQLGDELTDTFFRILGDEMSNWQRELKAEFKEIEEA
jgi:hypothetical protein